MLVYKILTDGQMSALRAEGEIAGAPVDLADGYVHLSTGTQVRETAAKHFSGQEGLWLLALDSEALGAALRWEPSRGGTLFPHLHAALRLSDVLRAEPLPLGPDGRHRFPQEIA